MVAFVWCSYRRIPTCPTRWL